MIQQLYAESAPSRMAELLPDRSYNSIATRAFLLGVKKSKQYMHDLGCANMEIGFNRFGQEHWEKPIGSTRNTGSRTLIKVGRPDVWKPLHTYIWEQANGPIPEGFIVVAKDGNRKNADIKNLCLRTFSEHVIRCCPNYRHLPEEIVDILHLQNEIKKTIKKRTKHEK
ncbi:HNH endonuclease signature motif containing protein [Pseudomonas sp. AB6]|uniref:HNH endonuclease signature motif containing protein n=1 Tax=Pseudomonas sp. AB6 TaxID=3048598 RepID=UPI002AB4DA70|nr:HNH endonuclease signature motif containing protein [Pseudomonas sp. AB6]MDY7560172.1 HNH endonuclease signature motif containing protein [Pseudomonas sp. AB6]MEB0211359.1 HNH endonuclease signature motif containing protein [Pseudomonas sp. AB6]